MSRKYILGIIALIIFLLYRSSIYTGITGMVIDADSGQPIEGAVVLVEWTKTSGFGEYHTESYKVVEKITDKDGRFALPGVYMPLVDPPRLTIYRKGYVAWNSVEIFPGYKKRSDFVWEDATIKLERYKPEYSYIDHESFISGAIRSSIGNKKLIKDSFYWECLEASKERDEMRRDKKRIK